MGPISNPSTQNASLHHGMQLSECIRSVNLPVPMNVAVWKDLGLRSQYCSTTSSSSSLSYPTKSYATLRQLDDELPTYPCALRLTDRFVKLEELASKLQLNTLDMFFTPTLRCMLRRRMLPDLSTSRRRDSMVVAMHVRRGDVSGSNLRVRHRYVSDEFYLLLRRLIIAALPPSTPIEFHIHSEQEASQSHQFEIFQQAGFVVHLNGDLVTTWMEMAAADVFVMAKSSFSYTPALLATGSVLFIPFWHMPLASWVSVFDLLRRPSAWVPEGRFSGGPIPSLAQANAFMQQLIAVYERDSSSSLTISELHRNPGLRRPTYSGAADLLIQTSPGLLCEELRDSVGGV